MGAEDTCDVPFGNKHEMLQVAKDQCFQLSATLSHGACYVSLLNWAHHKAVIDGELNEAIRICEVVVGSAPANDPEDAQNRRRDAFITAGRCLMDCNENIVVSHAFNAWYPDESKRSSYSALDCFREALRIDGACGAAWFCAGVFLSNKVKSESVVGSIERPAKVEWDGKVLDKLQCYLQSARCGYNVKELWYNLALALDNTQSFPSFGRKWRRGDKKIVPHQSYCTGCVVPAPVVRTGDDAFPLRAAGTARKRESDSKRLLHANDRKCRQ